jgi:hypothetical protein
LPQYDMDVVSMYIILRIPNWFVWF